MHSMFKDAKLFNKDISNWDVSNVTNMDFMFQDALAFNQDLSGWRMSISPKCTIVDMFKGTDMSKVNINNLCVRLAFRSHVLL